MAYAGLGASSPCCRLLRLPSATAASTASAMVALVRSAPGSMCVREATQPLRNELVAVGQREVVGHSTLHLLTCMRTCCHAST